MATPKAARPEMDSFLRAKFCSAGGRIAAMTHAEKIASLINAKPSQVDATVRLLDEGNTVPFIARYRKEMTGSLDDEQVRIVAGEIAR